MRKRKTPSESGCPVHHRWTLPQTCGHVWSSRRGSRPSITPPKFHETTPKRGRKNENKGGKKVHHPSGLPTLHNTLFGAAQAGNSQKAVWGKNCLGQKWFGPKVVSAGGHPWRCPPFGPHSSEPLHKTLLPPDRPTFLPFFPSSASIFALFLWGLLVEFLVVFEASVPTVHVWVHGLSCETPGGFCTMSRTILQLICPSQQTSEKVNGQLLHILLLSRKKAQHNRTQFLGTHTSWPSLFLGCCLCCWCCS